ncbi:hypothetical protein ACIBCM_04655 [Streptomyces sp. NPDC051018]|uniref:hypothetical protein n=1 Tax=Streptomyces sp. NPDC051018 TaxID=3365639 RepID=UPI0037AC44C2
MHLRRHHLRHTGLPWFAGAGVPARVLRRIAGHGSLLTTRRYLNPRELHQTGEKSQVARSRRGLEGLRGYYDLAV